MPHRGWHLSSRLYLSNLFVMNTIIRIRNHLIRDTWILAGCLAHCFRKIYLLFLGSGRLIGDYSVFQSLPIKKSHNFHCHKWFIRIWSWVFLFDCQCKRHLGMFCEMRPGRDARKGDWGENLAFGWLLKLPSKSSSAVMSLEYPQAPGQD